MAKISKYSNNEANGKIKGKLIPNKVFFIFWDKYKLLVKSEQEKNNIVSNLKKQNKKVKIITKFTL